MSGLRCETLQKTLPRRFMLGAVLLYLPFAAFGLPRLLPDTRLAGVQEKSTILAAADFIYYALVASGISAEDLPQALFQLNELAADLRIQLDGETDQLKVAEKTLSFLFERVINRYSEFQTRVDIALLNGQYNCVSSSVLFAFFAKSVGLEVQGVETPDHALVTISVDDRIVDVETTNPHGVDPGTKRVLPTDDPDTTRYFIVPRTFYRNRQPVSERRLLALIYSNRIAALERQGRFDSAFELAVDASFLQGAEAPASFFVERVLNYTAQLSNTAAYLEAINFLDTVEAVFGTHPKYLEYSQGIINNMVNAIALRKEWESAIQTLVTWSHRLPETQYRTLSQSLHTQLAQEAINTLPYEEGISRLQLYRDAVPLERYESLYVYAVSREAMSIAKQREWMAAAALLEAALLEFPNNRDLKANQKIYRDNYAVDIHNAFSAAANRGDMLTARQILLDGLEVVPESKLLQDRLRQVDAALQ